MTADDLTPPERDAVQLHFVRRWAAARCRVHGRRRGDKPMTTSPLSRAQLDRYWRWLVEQRRKGVAA